MKQGMMISLILLTAVAAHAENTERGISLDPVVVTATKTETLLSQVASSMTVITAEDIALKQAATVVDLLRTVPAVDVVQTGGVGGQTSVFIRGTDNRHTLILVDGIEVTDPAGVERAADLADLTVDEIERIEIIRGPQSVLYGSDAIGGVIQIFTRKAEKGLHGFASASYGSFDTFKEKAGLSGGGDWGRASLAVTRTDSHGFSSADKDNGNTEADGYENTTVVSRFSLQPTKTVALNGVLRYIRARDEFDSTFPTISDADDFYDRSKQLYGRTEIFWQPSNLWSFRLGAALSDLKRDNIEGASETFFDGRLIKFDLQSQLALTGQTVILGAETEEESADSFNGFSTFDEKARISAVYLQDQFAVGGVDTTAGIRLDHHDRFGNELTWRLASSYTIQPSQTRVKATVGTGFEAPSLFQLFSDFGNPNLQAETSLGWDVGLEQPLMNKQVVVSLSWFQNRIEDFVDFDTATFTYQNLGTIQSQGVETGLRWYPSNWADLLLSYTYTDTEDRATGARLLRRPLHKGALEFSLYPTDRWTFNISTQVVGERDDTGGAQLGGYTLVNLASSYQIAPWLKLFGRVDNLFDKNYEEVDGYGVAGLSGTIGLEGRI